MLRIHKLMEAAKEGDAGNSSDADSNSAAHQDLERRAKDMGWSPKDQWRGAPERWVDAEVFVRRGEEIMPILQANSRKEQARIQKLEADNAKLQASLNAATESIQVLTSVYDKASLDTAKQKRKELLRAQAQARTDDDSDLEVELGEQIADQTAIIRDAEKEGVGQPAARQEKKAAAAASQSTNPTSDPNFIAWNQDNPWFGTDTKKTALATEIGREIRSNPANVHLQGRAFFDEVTKQTDAYYAQFSGGRATGSKVEGSSGGGGGGGGGNGSGGSTGSGKSFNDLPADAKVACERQASWVVGDKRAFKDIAAWKKHYVHMYFNS